MLFISGELLSMKIRPAVPAIVLVLAAVSAVAEEWPCWRGPRGDGSSTDAAVPLGWDGVTGKNLVWKTEFPFTGHSSPIVYRDHVYVTGADETPARRMLRALDRQTGEKRWDVVVDESPLERKHKLNSWASGTPAADAERVYVTFLNGKEMVVAAYRHDGTPQWKVKPGVFSSVHGYCSCPVLFEGLVIVNGDHDGDAYLVALNQATGETVWKTPRENRTRSYCTPIIRELGGRTQMILSGSKCVASYDPRTGARHWILDGPTEQFVASPVENKGLIFITGGFPDKHILAIDPTGTGQLQESLHIRWRHLNKGVSYVPSPVAAGDWFFCVSDGGVASCYDAVTGEVRWQERLGRHHSGSLVAVGDRILFLDDDGITHVLKAGPLFEVLATNSLGEEAYSSPAISNGRIFIRGAKHVFCFGQ